MMNNLRRAGDFALSFTSLVLSTAAIVGLVTVLAAYSNRPVSSAAPLPDPPAKAKKTMRSFGSDEELRAYLKKLAEEQKRDQRARAAEAEAQAPSTTANQAATGLAKESVTVTKDESITNTQHAGVDEGGIVKLHGDHLVVLRRGR